jgi:hypothetical protein
MIEELGDKPWFIGCGFMKPHAPFIAPKQLAQYILRHPFSVAKMTLHSGGEKVICGSKLNPTINCKFQIFTGPDSLAMITQHIPEKGAQMIRYYHWYSNQMRGQRHRVPKRGVFRRIRCVRRARRHRLRSCLPKNGGMSFSKSGTPTCRFARIASTGCECLR